MNIIMVLYPLRLLKLLVSVRMLDSIHHPRGLFSGPPQASSPEHLTCRATLRAMEEHTLAERQTSRSRRSCSKWADWTDILVLLVRE